MNILFFTARVPYPPNRGDRIRIFHFIRELSHHHNVSLLCFYESDSQLPHLEVMRRYCSRVEAVKLTKRQSYVNCLQGALTTMPFQCVYYRSQEMRKKIRQLLREASFDLLHMWPIRVAQYVDCFDSMPAVIDYVDCKTMYHRRALETQKSPIPWFLNFQEWRKMRRYEVETSLRFARCLLISEVDKQYLESRGGVSNLAVVPNGIDLSYFRPMPEYLVERDSLAFVGTMDVHWNIDAALFFCHRILPEVRKEVPGAKLYVVGRNPPSEIKRLAADPRIVVTGEVADVRPFMARAVASVVPMRVGAGIKNKVLESMAMKKPVISTTVGNEGIEARSGEHLLVADDPMEFARGVVTLLTDKRLGDDMAERGYHLVCDKYQWSAAAQMLESIYAKVT